MDTTAYTNNNNKFIIEQNKVLTAMIASIASGITFICCILCIGTWCRHKNLKSNIVEENNPNELRKDNFKDTTDAIENKVDFPHGAVNLRSVTSIETGENDSISATLNLETNKNETIGEQDVQVDCVDVSKSHDSLYEKVVSPTEDGIELQLAGMSDDELNSNFNIDNAQMNQVSRLASRSISKNSEGGDHESGIDIDDKNSTAPHVHNDTNVSKDQIQVEGKTIK